MTTSTTKGNWAMIPDASARCDWKIDNWIASASYSIRCLLQAGEVVRW